MAANLKPYAYIKGADGALDAQFADAQPYARARVGRTHIFWKAGFRWYCIPITNARRIFRRLLPVRTKLCCGGANFMVEWLVLVLEDGTELELYLGEDVQAAAESLLAHLKDQYPQISYGRA